MALKTLNLTFRLDELSAEGRAFEGELPVDVLSEDLNGLCGTLGFRVITPAKVSGTAYLSGESEVIISAKCEVRVGFDCARCLEAREMDVKFRGDYVMVQRTPAEPVKPSKSKKGKEAEPEDVCLLTDEDLEENDTYPFDGDTIDLSDLFRQNLVLEMPMNPKCEIVGEKCVSLGTHTGSGEDSSEKSEEESIDPRWAPLLALKRKMGE